MLLRTRGLTIPARLPHRATSCLRMPSAIGHEVQRQHLGGPKDHENPLDIEIELAEGDIRSPPVKTSAL